MTDGVFKDFRHDHRFQYLDGKTVMTDTLCFCAPLGPLGLAAERLVLRRYLTRFLLERNEFLKQAAESEMLREYMPSSELI